MLETPTFIADIISKIVLLLRKVLTHEQRIMLKKSVQRLTVMNPISWKKFRDWVEQLNKQPDIIFVGLD